MSPLRKPINNSNQQPNNHSQPSQQAHQTVSPGPPPQAHFSPQQSMNVGQPHPQAGMMYGQPAPQQQLQLQQQQPQGQPPLQQQQQPQHEPWIFLGFNNTMHTQRAIYGPPGSQFDFNGNVFFAHDGGSKEYVLPYRGYNGKFRTPPQPEDDCCGFWHWIGYRTDYHWQSTEYQQSPYYQQAVAANR